MDIDVTRPELQLLAGSFPAMSSGTDTIDARMALRALFLLRNGIPLSPALLQPSSTESPGSLFREVSGLLGQVRVLLTDSGLSGDSSEAIRKLAEALGNFTGQELLPAFPGGNSAENLTRTLTRSGLGFEWRLLAWFRAGQNPGMLTDLLREDLKGALLAFLGDLDRLRSRGGIDRKTGAMEESARNLLDRITGRQIDLILDTAREQRNAYVEIPWGYPEDRIYAGVLAKDTEKRKEDRGEPARFTLSLEIETTGLGLVRVKILFSGKKMTATFILRDNQTLSLAENMAGEFKEMLRARGYEPGVIRFTVSGEGEPYDTGPYINHDRIDRRG
jgi:hypothetical protein